MFTVEKRDPRAALLEQLIPKGVRSVPDFDPAVRCQRTQRLPDRPGSPREAFAEGLELIGGADQPSPPRRLYDARTRHPGDDVPIDSGLHRITGSFLVGQFPVRGSGHVLKCLY